MNLHRSLHTCQLHWQRGGHAFTDRRYSRVHRLSFDGGAAFDASASPSVVPPPGADPAAVDPEELFVASLSSCHMLWFLDTACRAGWCVDDYHDEAEGELAHDEQGRLTITRVTLRPRVRFAGAAPSNEAHEALHHRAHASCFIANAVLCELRCEPQLLP